MFALVPESVLFRFIWKKYADVQIYKFFDTSVIISQSNFNITKVKFNNVLSVY